VINNDKKISILCGIIAFIIVKTIDAINYNITNMWLAISVIFLSLLIAHKRILIPLEMLTASVVFACIGTMGSIIRIMIGLCF
jgi:hypothetical protein